MRLLDRSLLLFGCLSSLLGCAQSRALRASNVAAEQRAHGLGLVVLVSIDQLRADLPKRLLARLPEGGFRRLYGEGVEYEAVAYAHSATETAVGHATLSTGALPKDHGIVGNEWSEHGARIYAVDDATQELVGGSGVGKGPGRLLVETVGDVLARERPRSLSRSVSVKERAAILLAGQSGAAYWLHDASGSFISSRAYLDALPAWVAAFTARHPLDRFAAQGWRLSQPDSAYLAADDLPWEQRGCGRARCVFPYSFEGRSGEQLVRDVKQSPLADELVLAFVAELLAREPLGRDDDPDLLALSFSATDYVGHAFGPESREAEDNLLRLDRTLAALFALLEQRVGLGHFVLVLSADHGACESPESFTARGLDAGRVDPELLRRSIDTALRERFHVGVELVADFVNPSLVLHEQRIASLSLDLAQVERAAAELALSVPGVQAAFARSDLLAGSSPAHPFKERIERSTHGERSGHVYIVPKQHWLLATKPEALTAMHGTPWPYDAEVPLVVWGSGAAAQRVKRAVDPRDIAPTLAQLLRISVPRGATGSPLVEALAPAPAVAAPAR